MMYYTILQLAQKINITDKQLFQILLDCCHVGGQDGVYAVWQSGQELGGIDCELPNDDYGVMFPLSLLDDTNVKEGIQKIHDKTKQYIPILQLISDIPEIKDVPYLQEAAILAGARFGKSALSSKMIENYIKRKNKKKIRKNSYIAN